MDHSPSRQKLGQSVGAKAALVPLLAIGAVVLGQFLISGEMRPARDNAVPEIAPRAELYSNEMALSTLYQEARSGVVSITLEDRGPHPAVGRFRGFPMGQASGFFWDDEGHIVTNAHALDRGSAPLITLADGRRLRASIVGIDQRTDLAVLRVSSFWNLPSPLPLGRAAEIMVGQDVIAIGNPFGLDFTLTRGIVSATDRTLRLDQGTVVGGLIQTDAAINPGNSGGPLLDSAGRVVGVNTAIYSPSGGSNGIGFAIPTEIIVDVVPELIRQERLELAS